MIQLSIPNLINRLVSVSDNHIIFVSLQRGFITSSKEQHVSSSYIYLTNIWRWVNNKIFNIPETTIREYYTDVSLLKNSLLGYSDHYELIEGRTAISFVQCC